MIHAGAVPVGLITDTESPATGLSFRAEVGHRNWYSVSIPESVNRSVWTPTDRHCYRPSMDYKQLVRNIPDFPQPGVMFRDITPLLGNPTAFKSVVQEMAKPYETEKIDAVVAVEARGYLFGAPIAYALDAAFVPVRKLGKLPWEKIQSRYELEYGIETVEMHADGVRRDQRILIVDDVIATGGTLQATIELVEKVGGRVAGVSVFIELTELGGKERLAGHDVHSLVVY
jgi:adenine phosphoribosyltransferase